MDALWRSVVVFLFTWCVALLVMWLLQYVYRQNASEQEQVHQEHGQQDRQQVDEGERADGQGQYIHLQTPEEEFIPWEPESMREDESGR